MNKLSPAQFKQGLGNKITKRRKELSLSQEQLANSIGRNKQFNSFEVDGANPTTFVLKELALALE